jgi:hypothetical protein
MKALLAATALFLSAAVAVLAQAAGACPPEGDATKAKVRDLNTQKARMTSPSDDDIDDTVTMDSLEEPGDDTMRFDNGTAVSITGYVMVVRDGGPNSSNCHSQDPADQGTVLELAPDGSTPDPGHRVFAVVTPRWRAIMAKQGQDWTTRGLRAKYLHQPIIVTGWLLFDFEAANRAANTAPLPNPGITRNTAWEIHPVTDIEVDEEGPADQSASLTVAAP